MRTTIAVVLGAISLTSAFVFADKPDVAKSANDEVSTLFFGHDDRVPVNDTTQSPWDAVGQLETYQRQFMYGDADCTQSGINGRTLFIDAAKG